MPALRLLPTLTLASSLALWAPAATARVIDEFLDSTPVHTADVSIDDPYILGGERDVDFIATANFQVLSGAARLEGLGGLGFFGFHWDGNDGSTATSFDLPDIDLTDGGTSDRFVVDLSDLVGSMTVRVRVYEDAANFSSTPFGLAANLGRNEFLFADFLDDGGSGADFTRIRRVQFNLFSFDSGDVIEIDRIATEGATAPLDPFRTEQASAGDPGRIDDDADVLGGEREIALANSCTGTAEVSDGAARLACTGSPAGTSQLIYDGDDDSYVLDFGLPDTDLTGAGAHERVRVHVSDVSGPVAVNLSASESGSSFSFSDSHLISEPGIYDFPFGRFDNPVPLGSANMVRVFSDLDGGDSIAFDHIELVASPLIDAFEGEPPSVTNTASQLATNILGNERDVELALTLNGTFDVANGVGTLDVTSNSIGNLLLTYDGPDGATTLTPALLEDLTRNGSATRFEVDIAALTGTGMNVQITAGKDFSNRFMAATALDAGATLYGIPFSAFGVAAGTPSFDEIGFVIVQFSQLDAGDSISIESIGVGAPPPPKVPSSAPVGLGSLALGLLALGVSATAARGRSSARRAYHR